MTIEDLKREIQLCENNQLLTNEEKNIRLKVLQTYNEKLIRNQKYNQLIINFIKNGEELITLSKGIYQIEESLEWNKISLKGLILESGLCKYLENQGIEFTLSELKTYSRNFSQSNDFDISVIDKAIFLYELIEEIEKAELEEIELISRNLGDIIGNDIVYKSNKIREELSLSQKKALEKIEELYVNLGIFDRNTYYYVTLMVNQVFEYYIFGNRKLPIV